MGSSPSKDPISSYRNMKIPSSHHLYIPNEILSRCPSGKDRCQLILDETDPDQCFFDRNIRNKVEQSFKAWAPVNKDKPNPFWVTILLLCGIFILFWLYFGIGFFSLLLFCFSCRQLHAIRPKKKLLPTFAIDKIECIINSKIIKHQYQSKLQGGPRLLFHGTDPKNFEPILKENLVTEWSIWESLFHRRIDKGWFGNGTYLTSNILYAQHYINWSGISKETGYRLPNVGATAQVIGAWVLPGRTLVCTDLSYNGRDCKAGYDCHYARVKCKKADFYPCLPGENAEADEWCCFSKSQVVPMFLITLRRLV